MGEYYYAEATYSVFSFFLMIYGLVFAISITLYVLQGIGLYTIADRRGLRHAWLAWLPVGNIWLIGNIADHYRTVTRGEKQNRRIAILILSIAVAVLIILAVGLIFSSLFRLIIQAEGGVDLDEVQIATQVLSAYFGGLGLVVLANLTSIALLVVQYVCLSELYDSCDPGNKVLYLLLSILLGLGPIFIFVCRKKDLGMYPRAVAVPQYSQPVYQPVYQMPVYPMPEQPTPPVQPTEQPREEVPEVL